MSRYPFELAGPADDADLRQVLAATPMEGRLALSLRREPSWFEAAVVDGFTRHVVACRDLDCGRILGFGCRSLRELCVDGKPATVGYLSSLRVLPKYRKLGLVARGYAFFRRLHEDGQAPFYLTTIAEGNATAQRILTSGRAGLPTYHRAGRYHTIAITLWQRREVGVHRDIPVSGSPTCQFARGEGSIRPANRGDLGALLEFLAAVGPRRQFFPVYRADAFLSPTGLLRGLEFERILLAQRGGRIVGTLAAWDQQAFRQQIVHGYSGWLKAFRPLYNLAARLRGRGELPAPGMALRVLMAALPVIADDNLEVFDALLGALRSHCSGGPWSHLLIGLHDSDPLLPLARRFQSACYTSLLFLVSWPDGNSAHRALEARPVYLELGSL